MKQKISIFFLFIMISSFLASNLYANETQSTLSNNTSVVGSINLQVSDNNLLKWTLDGYSKNGFKIVWSKNENPTYPLRDGDKYHYYTDPNKNTDTVEAFDGIGAYYVRVCEYLGGTCGVYSNQVKVEFLNNDSIKNNNENKPTIKTNNNDNNITDANELPANYEKISNIEAIKYYEKIKKVGDTDLYGIKIVVKIPEGKEWIKSLADLKYFKNIQKVGDNLYGTRISDEKKKQIQKQIDNLNAQIKKMQDQITKLNEQLSSIN